MNIKSVIESDSRVESISDERDTDDGIWIYLKSGYENYSTETRIIHESTWSKCLEVLRKETYQTH